VTEQQTYYYQSSLSSSLNPDGSFATPAYTSAALVPSEIPAPGTPDGTYYWHARTCDTTYGCGDWSDYWTFTVDSTMQEASSGNVVINEIMWMGSTGSDADEWIELRNMTSSPIIIKNWVIENAGTAGSPNLTIPSGTIPANGYFLIANYSSTDANSALSDTNITVNWVTTGLELLNGGEKLVLKDAAGNTIDQTPVTDGDWAAGTNASTNQSMERNLVPGDGTSDSDWHTCTDVACNDTTYWDVEGDDYGTPAGENHSENDLTSLTELLEDILGIEITAEDPPVIEEAEEVEEVVEPEESVAGDEEPVPAGEEDVAGEITEEETAEEGAVEEIVEEVEVLEGATDEQI